jgi:hypothetical protein
MVFLEQIPADAMFDIPDDLTELIVIDDAHADV